jgi:hypothetical protein
LLNGAASLAGRYRHVAAVGDLLHFHVRNSRWDALRACAPARHHRNGVIGTSDHAARLIFEETRYPDDYRAIDACLQIVYQAPEWPENHFS